MLLIGVLSVYGTRVITIVSDPDLGILLNLDPEQGCC
jgi:hypothetical protein